MNLKYFLKKYKDESLALYKWEQIPLCVLISGLVTFILFQKLIFNMKQQYLTITWIVFFGVYFLTTITLVFLFFKMVFKITKQYRKDPKNLYWIMLDDLVVRKKWISLIKNIYWFSIALTLIYTISEIIFYGLYFRDNSILGFICISISIVPLSFIGFFLKFNFKNNKIYNLLMTK